MIEITRYGKINSSENTSKLIKWCEKNNACWDMIDYLVAMRDYSDVSKPLRVSNYNYALRNMPVPYIKWCAERGLTYPLIFRFYVVANFSYEEVQQVISHSGIVEYLKMARVFNFDKYLSKIEDVEYRKTKGALAFLLRKLRRVLLK